MMRYEVGIFAMRSIAKLQSPSNMQVVVLAGGVGSRLRPWTNDIPKPLLPMLDATLLERVVEGVPSDLVDEVVVAGGYKVDNDQRLLQKCRCRFRCQNRT